MRPKVIIDTNVFLSGLLFGGNPGKILQKWSQHQFILCLSPQLKAEILTKLHYKFDAPDEFVQFIEDILDIYTAKYLPKHHTTICKDPTDNFLLDLARESKAAYLVSGDKDVLVLKNHNQTKIISPREFLETI